MLVCATDVDGIVPVAVVLTVAVLSVVATIGTTCTLGPLAGTVGGATAARGVIIVWIALGAVVLGATGTLTPGAIATGYRGVWLIAGIGGGGTPMGGLPPGVGTPVGGAPPGSGTLGTPALAGVSIVATTVTLFSTVVVGCVEVLGGSGSSTLYLGPLVVDAGAGAVATLLTPSVVTAIVESVIPAGLTGLERVSNADGFKASSLLMVTARSSELLTSGSVADLI